MLCAKDQDAEQKQIARGLISQSTYHQPPSTDLYTHLDWMRILCVCVSVSVYSVVQSTRL